MLKDIQFLILNLCGQRGDVNLDNVTHEDAVSALKATGERVQLVLIPGPRHGQPSPRTSRANTRKYSNVLVAKYLNTFF